MTEIDTDKLRALADALGQVPDDTPDAAYFGIDMTHGQARENLAAILAMAEDNQRLREALEPFARHIGKDGEVIRLEWGKDHWTGTLSPEDFTRARRALGKDKA